eukprot:1150446-Pelagomonas_calceolata.AAC.5
MPEQVDSSYGLKIEIVLFFSFILWDEAGSEQEQEGGMVRGQGPRWGVWRGLDRGKPRRWRRGGKGREGTGAVRLFFMGQTEDVSLTHSMG